MMISRYSYHAILALLLSQLAASSAVKDTGIEGIVSNPTHVHANVDVSANRNAKSRDLSYTFDEDDLFLHYTTEVPTISMAPSASAIPSTPPTVSMSPTNLPSTFPSPSPTSLPSVPPSSKPTKTPTSAPSLRPSTSPTLLHSSRPSDIQSDLPSSSPSSLPSANPTSAPTASPSGSPSNIPSAIPSDIPSNLPTASPSKKPTDVPSPSPTQSPTDLHSNSPSDPPTLSPSIYPSLKPSKAPTSSPSMPPTSQPTTSPSNEPSTSFQPSNRPTVSAGPSSGPTMSQSPSELRRNVDISMFFIEIISDDSNLDQEKIVSIAEDFLNNYMKEKLPKKNSFIELQLQKRSNGRRRLGEKSSIACDGMATFGSVNIPSRLELDKHVFDAFRDDKKRFISLLQNGGDSVINAGAQVIPKAGNGSPTITKTVIIIIVAGAIIGIAVSFFVQQMIKRGLEKRVNTHAFKYEKQLGNGNGNDNDDIEMNTGFEPKPLIISDDEDLVERNMIRLQHEKEIMRRANERLHNSSSQDSSTRIKKVKFDAMDLDLVVQASSSSEDDATITSIQFSSSGESTVSSLGGLNQLPDPMDPIKENAAEEEPNGGAVDDSSEGMDSVERRTAEINPETNEILKSLNLMLPCVDDAGGDEKKSDAVARPVAKKGQRVDIPREVFASGEPASNRSSNKEQSDLTRRHLKDGERSQSNSVGGSSGENSYFTNIFTRRY